MKIFLISLILVLTCGYSKNKTSCEDPQYLELIEKNLDELTEREFEMLKVKEQACTNEKAEKIKKTSKRSSFGMVTLVALGSVIVLYILISRLGS